MQLFTFNLTLFNLLSTVYDHVENNATRIRNTVILLIALIGKKSLHILMADDDEEDRDIFATAIRELSPEIKMSIAVNGKELMEMLKDEDSPLPDILFLDLNMPFKNGQECLKEIRNNSRLKKLPVIIYSTSSNSEYIDQTYRGGANYYLPKPDSFHELKLIAENLFSLDWSAQSKPVKEKFVLRANYFK